MVVSDSDTSGEKDTEQEPKASRPTTAAERRERRASARPSGKSGDAKAPKDKSADAKDRPTPKRDRKEKKSSPLSRLMRFAREVWAELRKVIWPTRKQMVTYTTVVLVFVIFMVALVSGLDLLFAKGVFWLFG
ncbi:preprotein translocase subunit SecE [Amycolatopsis sp. cg5]|uniref:preprotein translocase subunit SecE n=1 Tax=Amycolatopsis TaxID=1813 RepID=UPI000B829C30|nr:preprotein translocase subunit SecE [Amycolatopsis xylanica]